MESAVHILNNVPSKSVSETPFELWRGRKSSLSHFRIWSCPTHVLVTNFKKLEKCLRLCQFVGYPKETRGGLFFDPHENRVFVSTTATFLEEDHMKDHKLWRKLVLSKATDESIRVVDEASPSSRIDETNTSGQSHPSQSLRMSQRSERIVSQPNRYLSLTKTIIPDMFDAIKACDYVLMRWELYIWNDLVVIIFEDIVFPLKVFLKLITH